MKSALRWLALIVALALLVIALSYARGCWRDWRGDHPKPPPIPDKIDQGTPTEPEQPKQDVETPLRADDLSREELIAALAKYGLKVAVPAWNGPRRSPVAGDRTNPRLGIPSGEVPVPEPADEPGPIYPLRLTEETFCLSQSEDGSCPGNSPSIDVAAWLFEAGGDVDLTGRWNGYQPDPCPEARIFQNVARFRKSVGIGAIGACVDNAGERVCDVAPAVLVGLDFQSVRVGPAQLELGLHAGLTQRGTGAMLGGISLTW